MLADNQDFFQKIRGLQYGEVVNLAGKPVTYPELAQAASLANGKQIDIKVIAPQQLTTALNAVGLDQMGSQLALTFQDYAMKGNNGEAQAVPTEFEQVLGHSLTSLPKAVNEVISGS